MYLDLMIKTLTDYYHAGSTEYKPLKPTTWKLQVLLWVNQFLVRFHLAFASFHTPSLTDRLNGKDWPARAETMIGVRRMLNLKNCIIDVIENKIPGDLIETGVWRGGACMLMKAVLKAYNEDRYVVCADSFAGLPKPSGLYDADRNDTHWKKKELAVESFEVRSNFIKYGLLDRKVSFLKGLFRDTLHLLDMEFAIIRLDGDMYESTWDALTALYPKLSVGGYCIIDDYILPGARQAVLDYFTEYGINEEIIDIDGTGVYFKKTK
jgi:O-methyltransferase